MHHTKKFPTHFHDQYLCDCLQSSGCVDYRWVYHFLFCFLSGKVAKEVMEQSAKIKRDPPEIHRSPLLSYCALIKLHFLGMKAFVDICLSVGLCVCVFCLCMFVPGLAWCPVGAVHLSPMALVSPVCPGPGGELCTSP